MFISSISYKAFISLYLSKLCKNLNSNYMYVSLKTSFHTHVYQIFYALFILISMIFERGNISVRVLKLIIMSQNQDTCAQKALRPSKYVF